MDSMKTLSLVKGKDHFCFRYEAGQEARVLDALIEMVNRRDMSFDWFDAVTVHDDVILFPGNANLCLAHVRSRFQFCYRLVMSASCATMDYWSFNESRCRAGGNYLRAAYFNFRTGFARPARSGAHYWRIR